MLTSGFKKKGNGDQVLAKIAASIKGPSKVKVGFPEGKLDNSVIMRAIFNEFGTAGSGKGFVNRGVGGFGNPIPERPFFRNAMRENQSDYERLAISLAKQITSGAMSMDTALNRIGLKAQGDIQMSITNLQDPPNTALTISIKGSSNPLIDTGEMRGAVTYAIED